MVALERIAGRSEPDVYVHSASGSVHCGHNGAHCPDIPIVRATLDVPTAQGISNCVEWGQLSDRSDAEAGDSQAEEEVRNEPFGGRNYTQTE